jgi:hypothetical protein
LPDGDHLYCINAAYFDSFSVDYSPWGEWNSFAKKIVSAVFASYETDILAVWFGCGS